MARPTKVIDAVLAHLDRAQSAEQEYKERFHDYELQYAMRYKRADVVAKEDKQARNKKAMQYIGYAHAQIETGTHNLMNELFRRSPFFHTEPMAGATMEEAEVVRDLHLYSLRKDRFKPKFRGATRFTLIYGTCILKHYWSERYLRIGERVPVPVDMTPDGVILWDYQEVRKPYMDYAGPCSEITDPYYFHIQPEAPTITDADWCIEEFTRSESYIRNLMRVGVYDNVRLRDVDVHTKNSSKWIDYRQRRRDVLNMPSEQEAAQTGDSDETQEKQFDIIEEWHNNRIITLVGRTKSKVLRDRPNPFYHGKKPYTRLVYIEIPGEFWGIPMSRQLEGPQHELNFIRRLRSEAMYDMLTPMWRGSTAAVMRLGTDQLKRRRDGIIEAETGEIEPLGELGVPGFAYKEEDIIRQDGDLMSGITDLVRGSPEQSDTATGRSIVANFASGRITGISETLVEGLEEALQMRHQLYGQFGSEQERVQVSARGGPVMVNLPIEVVRKEYLFRFEAGREAAKTELRRNQMMQMVTIAAQNPAIMVRTNWDLLLRDLWTLFDVPDANRYLLGEEDVNQQVLAMMLQQLGPQAGGAGSNGGAASPNRAETPAVNNLGDLFSVMGRATAPKVRTQ